MFSRNNFTFLQYNPSIYGVIKIESQSTKYNFKVRVRERGLINNHFFPIQLLSAHFGYECAACNSLRGRGEGRDGQKFTEMPYNNNEQPLKKEAAFVPLTCEVNIIVTSSGHLAHKIRLGRSPLTATILYIAQYWHANGLWIFQNRLKEDRLIVTSSHIFGYRITLRIVGYTPLFFLTESHP